MTGAGREGSVGKKHCLVSARAPSGLCVILVWCGCVCPLPWCAQPSCHSPLHPRMPWSFSLFRGPTRLCQLAQAPSTLCIVTTIQYGGLGILGPLSYMRSCGAEVSRSHGSVTHCQPFPSQPLLCFAVFEAAGHHLHGFHSFLALPILCSSTVVPNNLDERLKP